MSNFFSTDTFLCSIGESLYPKGQFEVEDVQVQGLSFRVLKCGRRYHLRLPFQDFLEPEEMSTLPKTTLRYLPVVSLRKIPASEWDSSEMSRFVAPTIDFQKFTSWESYVSYSKGLNNRAFSKNTAYKLRRLSREMGEVTFEFASQDENILELCLDWKSNQYQSSKITDSFAENSWIRKLFRSLYNKNALQISLMKAGDVAIAIHVGVVWKKRFYYWVPAYDPEYKRHSGGTILLEKMIEWSYKEGHDEFDFLEGGEKYKFDYATDARIIQRIGCLPLYLASYRQIREIIMPFFRCRPRLRSILRSIKCGLEARSLRHK